MGSFFKFFLFSDTPRISISAFRMYLCNVTTTRKAHSLKYFVLIVFVKSSSTPCTRLRLPSVQNGRPGILIITEANRTTTTYIEYWPRFIHSSLPSIHDQETDAQILMRIHSQNMVSCNSYQNFNMTRSKLFPLR